LKTIPVAKTLALNPPPVPESDDSKDKKQSEKTTDDNKKDAALPPSPPSTTPPVGTTQSQEIGVENLGSSITVSVKGKDAQVSIVPITGQVSSLKVEKPKADEKVKPKEEDSAPVPEEPKKMRPAFGVNDNSRIDVIVSSHEFETSMATNDFSAQSTEGSVGGGFGGVSASASYGQASSQSTSRSNSSNTYQKTMIAKYLVRISSPIPLNPSPLSRSNGATVSQSRRVLARSKHGSNART
jgi:hypothetical protein